MIYIPQEYPTQALFLVASMTLIGILGGYLVHPWFMIFSLVFWMQYTAILSYMQFKRKSNHKGKGITRGLLNPQIRFFLFETLAVIGIWFVLRNILFMVSIILLGWLVFALNFYFYYEIRKK